MMWFRKRGIVTSISAGHCIVVTPDGTYEKIPLPSPGVQIGAEVVYNRTLVPSGLKPLLMAASLLLVFMSSVLLHQAYVPAVAAYVSVDINPSLEFSVDRDLLVIDVHCLNEEAANLIKQENFKGKNLYDALARVIDNAVEQNYIKPGEDNLIVSTVSAGTANKVTVDQQAICKLVEKSLASKGRKAQVKMYTTGIEIRNEASNKGISPGKYLIYEQLIKTGHQVSIDQVKKQSIKKLVDEYEVELLPNYKKFTVKKDKKDSKPEINVIDHGKAVPVKEYIKDRKAEDEEDKSVRSRRDKNDSNKIDNHDSDKGDKHDRNDGDRSPDKQQSKNDARSNTKVKNENDGHSEDRSGSRQER